MADPNDLLALLNGAPPPVDDPSTALALALGHTPPNMSVGQPAPPDRNNTRPMLAGQGETLAEMGIGPSSVSAQQAQRSAAADALVQSMGGPSTTPAAQGIPPMLARPPAPPPARAPGMSNPGVGGSGPGPTSVSVKVKGNTPGEGPGMGAVAQMDAATQKHADAVREAATIGAARATEQAAFQAQAADHADAMAADQIAKQNAREASFNKQMEHFDQVQNDFNKISTTVDPSRWFNSRDTGQKVLAGLGVFLGGFGRHGNDALGLVKQAIADDIDAQKSTIQGNLEKGKQAIGNQLNLINIYRQKGLDDSQAEAATRSTMLQNAAQRLQAMGAKYDAPEMKAKAEAGAQALMQEAAKEKQTFVNQAKEIAIKQQLANAQSAEVGIRAMEAQSKGAGGPNSEFMVPNVGGVEGNHLYALNKETQKDAIDANKEFQKADSILTRLVEMRKKYGAEKLDRNAVGEMRSLAGQYVTAYNKSAHLGSLDAGTQQLMDVITGGDPSQIGPVLGTLEQLRNQQRKGFMIDMKSLLDPRYSSGSQGIDMKPGRAG